MRMRINAPITAESEFCTCALFTPGSVLNHRRQLVT